MMAVYAAPVMEWGGNMACAPALLCRPVGMDFCPETALEETMKFRRPIFIAFLGKDPPRRAGAADKVLG